MQLKLSWRCSVSNNMYIFVLNDFSTYSISEMFEVKQKLTFISRLFDIGTGLQS